MFKKDYPCKTCGCLIAKDRVNKVRVNYSFVRPAFDEYYCDVHKKPYQKVNSLGFGTGTLVSYYGIVQMTKDGKPIEVMTTVDKRPLKKPPNPVDLKATSPP